MICASHEMKPPSILKFFKILGQPLRVRLLWLLEREGLSVGEVQEILGMGQSRVSAQLGELRRAGLVEMRPSGKQNIYELSPRVPVGWRELVAEAALELGEVSRDEGALEHVRRKRQDQARAYFDQLAGKFGREYVPGRSWKSLAEGLIRVGSFGVVVDLGAGEGTLSQMLAPRAQRVIALDYAQKMVEHGTALALQHGLSNLEFRLGEIEEVPVRDGEADLVIFSQSLHHASKPLRALREAWRILKGGGQVMVLDLVGHQFEKARELYHDRWLGFSEVELGELLREAGFEDVETGVVDREAEPPFFQTLFGRGKRGS